MVRDVAQLHSVAEKCGREHGRCRDGQQQRRTLGGWWYLQASGEQTSRYSASEWWAYLTAADFDAVPQRGDVRGCGAGGQGAPTCTVRDGAPICFSARVPRSQVVLLTS